MNRFPPTILLVAAVHVLGLGSCGLPRVACARECNCASEAVTVTTGNGCNARTLCPSPKLSDTTSKRTGALVLYRRKRIEVTGE
uniref:Uncharacterized protein n=1 Tax=Arundo donax TaxID=35708 RepID=A0A0A9C3U1_ARUDO